MTKDDKTDRIMVLDYIPYKNLLNEFLYTM